VKLLRAILTLAAFGCITGCALLQPPPPTAQTAPLRPGEILSAQSAKDAVFISKSTKADVRAALGEATVIDFDSGYEVWVYRERLKDKAPPPRTEFVLLFAPSGILAKTRIR
jgi:hypothetical protein